MRILLLDQFSDLGGAQQGFLDVAAAIRDRGWTAVAGMPGNGVVFDRLSEMGVICERIDCGPYGSGSKTPGDVARFLAGTRRLSRQMRGLCETADADLVYLNGPRLLPAATIAGFRVPVVFHTHSLVTTGGSRGLAAFCLGRLDPWLLASCRFVAEPWSGHVRDERIAVAYNGVAGPPRGFRRIEAAHPRVGCIGRIAPEKGQLEFLAMARAICREIPDCRFSIFGAALFGEPGAIRYEQQVRRAAEALPVELHGWASDVYGALAEIDLLLVPSAAHEATTRVILEAFAAGVPVIAYRAGGIPEVIHDGIDGRLVDSPAEMVQVSIDLLSSAADRHRFAQAGRNKWHARFTVQRYTSTILDFLSTAAEAPPAVRAQRASSLCRP